MKKLLASTLTVLLFATSTVFAQTDDHAKAKKGAIIGGIAGAIAGGVISNNRNGHSGKRGAIVGGLAGTAAGAIVGAMMDKQERQLRQIPGVDVSRTADNELKVTVKNDVLFDYNSAGLRSASRASLREMANVFEQYPNTTIAVEGFTDSTGSAAYNERLSERRASSVANYLESLGVSGSRVDTIGYGESRPRATNSTASGRQLNRRVEIHVRANA
ncbi:MAG: OmpA family protein [Acidobacteria bacterium]|nr:OmpA family protein [Acidobacteriota bacterium]MBV9070297.1 OmpA family protein [Acidobacteriota bacterium]MBV9185435.1 OmpA family protein [Acidobacteriota bacterium]